MHQRSMNLSDYHSALGSSIWRSCLLVRLERLAAPIRRLECSLHFDMRQLNLCFMLACQETMTSY
jgi:hypothetical protein